MEDSTMRTRDASLHKRRKSEILAAAAKCFAARGIHQSSMQEICDAAKISAGALYRYFESKDAIIFALAESEKTANAQLIAHLNDSKDIVEGICQALPEIVSVLCDEQYGRLAIEIGAEASRNSAIAKVFASNEDELRRAFINALKLGQDRNTVDRNLNVEGAVFMILALFDGITSRSAFSQNPSRKQIVKSMERFIRRSLRGEQS